MACASAKSFLFALTNGRTTCGAIRRVWCQNDWHLRASQWAPAQASMALMQAGAWTSHAYSCLRFTFLRHSSLPCGSCA